MDRSFYRFVVVCAVARLFAFAVEATAAERVALLIGDSEYREPALRTSDTIHLPPIPMPAMDLKLMERTLLKAGFACTTLPDRTTSQMRTDVQAFAAVQKGVPTVLFYYSGHGLQQDGVNYLAGVDAKVDVSDKLPALEQARRTGALSAQDFEGALANLKRRNAQEQLLPLEEVLQTLNSMSATPGHRKIVLLDACRDPFAHTQREKTLLAMKSAGLIGKGSSGLAKPAERRGMFIGFSASAGEVSLGVPSEPSLFTRSFCEEALKPGATLRDAFDDAAQRVYEESARLIAEARKRATAEGRAIDGPLLQEAQTPAAYTVIFPGGFSFVPKGESSRPTPNIATHSLPPGPLEMAKLTAPIREVPAVVPSSTSSSVVGVTPMNSTKEAPYENGVGMRFVPVAIKEGPSGGKRVLFSVWETRAKDYREYAKSVNGVNREWENAEFKQGDDYPVVNVSWEDAKGFCEWLTRTERASGRLLAGWEYRLPSDHEWSCAVGIGDKEQASASPAEKSNQVAGYPWGSAWPPPNGSGNFASSLKVDRFAETAPVGSFRANGVGLYDLSGNVWEWCEDWYEPAKQEYRVLRGGSWFNNSEVLLRSSCRCFVLPSVRDVIFGFRCVLVPAGG